MSTSLSPELLGLVIKNIPSSKAKTLLNVALCCREWYAPTLTLLWRDAPLVAFIALLGPLMIDRSSNTFCFIRPYPTIDAWDRFATFAACLHSLRMGTHPDHLLPEHFNPSVYQTMLTYSPTRPLFPKLDLVHYHTTNANWPSSLSVLLCLATPTLKTFHLSIDAPGSMSGWAIDFTYVHRAASNVRELDLCCAVGWDPDVIALPIRGWTSLRKIEIVIQGMSQSLLTALAELPQLRRLQIDGPLNNKIRVESNMKLPPSSFPSLETLKICARLDVIADLFTRHFSPMRCRKLILRESVADPTDDLSNLEPFWGLFKTAFSSLTRIQLIGSQGGHESPTVISFNDLQDLRSCACLHFFSLNHCRAPFLTRTQLSSLLQAWPSLHSFYLKTCDCLYTDLPTPAISLDILDDFAIYCPTIRNIGLPLNGLRPYFDPQEDHPILFDLVKLDVDGCVGPEETDQAALYLALRTNPKVSLRNDLVDKFLPYPELDGDTNMKLWNDVARVLESMFRLQTVISHRQRTLDASHDP